MIGKENLGRVTSICVATAYATFATLIVYGIWGGLRIALVLSIFVVFWAAFYFMGIWITVERPAELEKKIPFTGKELRRRKNAFYEWLASKGR